MSMRNFEMRLRCTYSGSTNDIASLDVEHRVKDQWEIFDLATTSPGFEIFVYAVFTCQHMYMRVNCAERGLVLNSAEGSILIGAGKQWNIDRLRVRFSGQLAAGEAREEDKAYIVSRMKQCPVSINLRDIPEVESTLTLA